MKYYFSKIVDGDFDAAVEQAGKRLAEAGFGVLTDIDVKATMKKKLGADIAPYRILGACNPEYAHRALQVEDKIGTMLPCNVIVRETGDGKIEVAVVDPVASMQAIDNPELGQIAEEVQARLREVIEAL